MSDCNINTMVDEYILKVIGFDESVSLNMKNAHPVEMTKHMPVIITTNNDVKETLKEMKGQRADWIYSFLRRLIIAKFKSNYVSEYSIKPELQLIKNSTLTEALKKQTCMLIKNNEALINTIFGLSIMFAERNDRIDMPEGMCMYIGHCFDHLQKTIFGQWFHRQFEKSDYHNEFHYNIVNETDPNVNDSNCTSFEDQLRIDLM